MYVYYIHMYLFIYIYIFILIFIYKKYYISKSGVVLALFSCQLPDCMWNGVATLERVNVKARASAHR